MFVKRQFLLICLVVACLFQLPATFALPDIQQNNTSSHQVLLEPIKLMWNNIKPVVQEVRSNSPHALKDGQSTLTLHAYDFSDTDCKNPSNSWDSLLVQRTIQTGSITFDGGDESMTIEMTITPESNLTFFTVDLSFNSGQLSNSYSFDGSQMKCSDMNPPSSAQISMSGTVCVQTTDFKQVTGSLIKSCFILGGAASIKADVQNIHKLIVAGGAVDMGCYSVAYQNSTLIVTYLGENSNTNIIKTASGNIVAPVLKHACGSSGNIVPSLLITFTVALVGFLRTSY